MHVVNLIRHTIESFPRDAVFTNTDLRHCGKRTAVDQALSRMAKNGVLVRVARGFYTLFRRNSPYRTNPEKLKQAIALKCGAERLLTPLGAARKLGLRKRKKAPVVWVTEGSRRRIRMKDGVLVLKPRGRRASLGRGSKAGTVVMALRGVRRRGRVSARVVGMLRRRLSLEEKRELRELSRRAPVWMESALEAICETREREPFYGLPASFFEFRLGPRFGFGSRV